MLRALNGAACGLLRPVIPLKQGFLREGAGSLIFASDYSFTSASAAAATVIEAIPNGRLLWKLADGQRYGDSSCEG
ncbi:DUF4357 domain-containing protein [Rhodobacteraceae bacterium NNCM2]|nr:DUF4357 domain-containing protein [Coraliihabitans acroporae]